MRKVFLTLVVILNIIFVSSAFPQTDTFYVVSDTPSTEGNLNHAIESIIRKGTLSKTIFMLEQNGYYILTDSILIPSGENLTIVAPEPKTAQQTAPPQILWSSRTNIDKKYFFISYGNLILKNVWILSIDTEGNKIGSSIIFKQTDKLNKQQCNFEGVIFDSFTYSFEGNGAITVACKNFIGEFKNCYWKNFANEFLTHQGKAITLSYDNSNWHIDSLVFENCTFENLGEVYEQQENNYADYVKFNHCTFLNVVRSPLQSGSWYKLVLTNNLFVNTFMYGYIPAVDDYKTAGGIFRIDSISSFTNRVPFAENDRKILFANNNYYIENWLSNWMKNNPWSLELHEKKRDDFIPRSQPLLNQSTKVFFESNTFMNMSNIDSINPRFLLSPTDTASIKQFLLYRWSNIGATQDWAWKPENSINRLWPLEENLAYTNDSLLNAGMGRFPLGDLYHWFPEKYKEWENQKEYENEKINLWLETGRDTVVNVNEKDVTYLTFSFILYQNYPNPFNPTTVISYQLPERSLVTIKVYDILGREIATLVNEYQDAGSYKVEFSADKYQLSSGIYFYTLKAGKNYIVKKMMLTK